MIQLKRGVAAVELHPGVRWALDVTSAIFLAHGLPRAIITSLSDSRHSDRSFHYGRPGDARCRAFDIRTRNVYRHAARQLERTWSGDEGSGKAAALKAAKTAAVDSIAGDLRLWLGPAFDIVVESDHIHCELDADELGGLG